MDIAISSLRARTAPRPRPVRQFLRAMLMRRSRRRLLELDDYLLRDVGLGRSEARREAERPCWNAPAHWLR